MALAVASRPLVVDETAPLVTVLLHRPGFAELGKVTGATSAALLFDGPVDAARASRDHDALTTLLAERGVEVLELDALAGEPLDPLPNRCFTRDTSVWIGDEVVIATMARVARRREPEALDSIYAHQPRFASAARHRLPVEGGDVFVCRPGALVCGVGQRTTLPGAASLIGIADVDEVLVIMQPLPGSFHLDLLMSIVDRETVVCHPALLSASALRLRPHTPPRRIDDVRAALAGALGVPSVRIIDVGNDPPGDHDRTWDHGANLLTLAPGVVVAYEDNTRVNRLLRRAGLEVLEMPGARLGRGRGGPRCLTCPIRRSTD